MSVWSSVRVKRTTLQRLRALAASIVLASQEGSRTKLEVRPDAINPEFLGVSLDEVIGQLLDERERKTARKVRHQQRKKARRQRERSETSEDSQGPAEAS